MIVGVAVCPAAPWLIDGVAPGLAVDPAVCTAAIRQAAADLRSRSQRILAVVPAARWSVEGWIPAIADDLGPSPYGPGPRADGSGTADGAVGSRRSTAPLPGALWVARTLLGPGPLDALVLPSQPRDTQPRDAQRRDAQPGDAQPGDTEPGDTATALPREVTASIGGPARWGLLVLADGARCHGDDAPSASDVGAYEFERRLAAALATGDPAVLGGWAAADRELGGALGATAPTLCGVSAALMTDPEPFEVDSRYLGAPYGVGYHLACWRR